jgi:hypothetical protein
MEGQDCSSCLFWSEIRESKLGDCRRFPPQVYVDDYDEPETTFPRTLSEEWCGEHKPRE